MKATMDHVAQRANVSKALVSRFLKNRSGVGSASALRIQEAIEYYHYRLPGMPEGNAIAIMVSGISYFHHELLRGCSDIALAQGYVLSIVETFGEKEIKERCAEILAQGCVRGVIIYGSALVDQGAIEILMSREIPLVLVENDPPQIQAEKILVDNYRGQYEMTKALITAGYQDLRMVSWGISTRAGAERLSGFLAALREHSPAPGNSYVYPLEQLSYEQTFKIVEQLHTLRNLPEVFVCSGDTTARMVMEACTRLGYRIPEDIAVTGFDGHSWDGFYPWTTALTTMKQPLREMGEMAVKRLIRRIEKPDTPPGTTVFETQLVPGGTARLDPAAQAISPATGMPEQ